MTYDEKTRSVSRDEFYAAIREAESGYNAGVCAFYHENKDYTVWTVAGRAIGISRGRLGTGEDYYIIAETPVAWMVVNDDGTDAFVTADPNLAQQGQRALPLYTGPVINPGYVPTDNRA